MLMQRSLFLGEWLCRSWYLPWKGLLDRTRESLWTELDKGMNLRLKTCLVVAVRYIMDGHLVMRIVLWTALVWNLYTKIIVYYIYSFCPCSRDREWYLVIYCSYYHIVGLLLINFHLNQSLQRITNTCSSVWTMLPN